MNESESDKFLTKIAELMQAKRDKCLKTYGVDPAEFTLIDNTISHPKFGALILPSRPTHGEVEKLFEGWLGKGGQ